MRIFLPLLNSGLISNSKSLLSASALSNIAGNSSKALSILKVSTEINEQGVKKGANCLLFKIDCQLLINNHLPIRIVTSSICKSMGHNYEAHVRAYLLAKASNVNTAFDFLLKDY